MGLVLLGLWCEFDCFGRVFTGVQCTAYIQSMACNCILYLTASFLACYLLGYGSLGGAPLCLSLVGGYGSFIYACVVC